VRFPFLDHLRTLAILWMIIFHTAYDLKMLGFVDWNFSSGFWYAFPRIIAFTFLFCVGISLHLTHHEKINWNSLRQRSLKLGSAAFIISLVTYFTYPNYWIYFGTLHCIFLGSLLGAPLVHYRKLAGLIFVAILLGQYFLNFDIEWVSALLKRPSMDFIPIYPWFWTILLGILMAPYLLKLFPKEKLTRSSWTQWPSQHSLKIYLIHQPIIFGILWLIKGLV
jgi:uncharacterized membrane protein